MRAVKIVIIGAASANFGPVLVLDLIRTVLHDGGELVLVDVRQQAVQQMAAFAGEILQAHGAAARIEWSTDRVSALPGTDFVVMAAEADRLEAWKKDWEIPHRYGIRHTLGENRGPAGLSHTLRTAPLAVAIAKDIEQHCPHATMLIMTNPEDRLVFAVRAATTVRAFGYCDGLWDFKHNVLGRALGIPGEDIFVDGAGINHAVWIRSVVDTRNGSDLSPSILKLASDGFQPVGYHLWQRFGLWPHENDEHYGEYFPYAGDLLQARGFDFDGFKDLAQHWETQIELVCNGERNIDSVLPALEDYHHDVFGDAPPGTTLAGLTGSTPTYIANANMPNHGKIAGLPDDMIVELPAIATLSGLHGIGSITLPQAITSFLYREGTIQKLSAEAAVEGSRSKALTALELDPHVPSPAIGKQLLNDFLAAHRPLMEPHLHARLSRA